MWHLPLWRYSGIVAVAQMCDSSFYHPVLGKEKSGRWRKWFLFNLEPPKWKEIACWQVCERSTAGASGGTSETSLEGLMKFLWIEGAVGSQAAGKQPSALTKSETNTDGYFLWIPAHALTVGYCFCKIMGFKFRLADTGATPHPPKILHPEIFAPCPELPASCRLQVPLHSRWITPPICLGMVPTTNVRSVVVKKPSWDENLCHSRRHMS